MERRQSWTFLRVTTVLATMLTVVIGSVTAGGNEPAATQILRVVDPSRPPIETVVRERIVSLADVALRGDAPDKDLAITELRRIGPGSLDYLMHAPELRKLPRWSSVVDAVARQKDAEYCGLWWYTDLEEALAAAQLQQKPVLSLRLLGNLTDELSCANSRFFRTTLYPNAAVRDLLANRFVLHWQSVRPVPVITIDFGDGRRIRQTITGNSLHLVLDERGRTVDVLPGLYSAAAFVQQLQQAASQSIKMAGLEAIDFDTELSSYHAAALQSAADRWDALVRTAGLPSDLPVGAEHPIAVWDRLAEHVHGAPVLDETARRAVLEHAAPLAEAAGRLALAKSVTETPALRLLRNVSQIITTDSLQNEYHLQMRIRHWFAAGQAFPDRDALVRRIYAEIFLGPVDDPWYGLSRPDRYSALRNDGREDATSQNAGH